MQRSALCRSRRELSNAYLLAKIGVDTAENEPFEVWGKIQVTIHFTPWSAFVATWTMPPPPFMAIQLGRPSARCVRSTGGCRAGSARRYRRRLRTRTWHPVAQLGMVLQQTVQFALRLALAIFAAGRGGGHSCQLYASRAPVQIAACCPGIP